MRKKQEFKETLSHDKKLTEELPQEKKLLIHLRNQKTTGKLCDVVFVHEELKLYSHACVLASCSPYMKQLINTHLAILWGIKTPLSIRLTDIIKQHENMCFKCFENIIDFMYTSKIHVDRDHLKHVVYAAKLLQMNDLNHTCIQLSQNGNEMTNVNLAKNRKVSVRNGPVKVELMSLQPDIRTTKRVLFGSNFEPLSSSYEEIVSRQNESIVLRSSKTSNAVNLKHRDNSVTKNQALKLQQDNLKTNNTSKLPKISVGTVNTHREVSEGNPYKLVDMHDKNKSTLNVDENPVCQKAEYDTSCKAQLRTDYMAESSNNILLRNVCVGTGNTKYAVNADINKSKKGKRITSINTKGASIKNYVHSNSREKSNITTTRGAAAGINDGLPLLRCSVPTCNFTTTRNNSLVGHKKSHVLICSECKISFPDGMTFSQHISEIHGKCLSKIRQKIAPVPGITQLKCNDCGYSTCKEKLFIRHTKKWHNVSEKVKRVRKTKRSVTNSSHTNSSLQLTEKNCKINSVKANSEERFLQNADYNNNVGNKSMISIHHSESAHADNNIEHSNDTILQNNNELSQNENSKNKEELLYGSNTQQADIINDYTLPQAMTACDDLLTFNLNNVLEGLDLSENMDCESPLTSETTTEQWNYADYQSANYTHTDFNLNNERTQLNFATTILQPEEIYDVSSLKNYSEDKSYCDLLSYLCESEIPEFF